MRELMEDTFSGNKNDDVHELREFWTSSTFLTHQELLMTTSSGSSDGIVAITSKLDSLGRDMKKLKENVHAIQVSCRICKRTHLDKDCPLNKKVKRVKEVKYGEAGRTYPNNSGNRMVMVKIWHTNVNKSVKNAVLNERILDSFDVEPSSSGMSNDPYSRDLEEYRLVFNNEIEQLVNEYKLRIGKKGTSWTTYGKNVNKSMAKRCTCGTTKDLKKKNLQTPGSGISILLAVGTPSTGSGTYTASGNSLLAVEMPCAFYSQQLPEHLEIDSSFCTHKILMEDEFKPSVQPQRRVNLNIKEVVKKEVVKLLDAGLIYPIFDSPWRCMIAIFHELIEDSTEVFMDDFSIFGSSFDHYLKNLEKMLKMYEETNLVLNWEKCHFMVKERVILGHKVSSSGIKAAPQKSKFEMVRTIFGMQGHKNDAIELYDEDGNEFIVNKQRVKPYQKSVLDTNRDDDITLEEIFTYARDGVKIYPDGVASPAM
uniref:DNA-directed DNA polymerase n=1 Tax=Tanacetum cinerariifolium TaxID=118510 RepID=A0A6L2J3N6_TANCI|nr:DNA-directed DNA polymerase [Tanacetum cinerariifolium]